MKHIEQWRPVVGFEQFYEVSSFGRVRSLDKVIEQTSRRGKPYQWLKPGQLIKPIEHGYLVVALYGRDGERQTREVHALVARAFLGPMPSDAQVVRHWDDDPKNNHVSNLLYGTHADNRADAIRNGGIKVVTHCPSGHEYTPENTYVWFGRPTPTRYCKTCQRGGRTTGKVAA